MAIGGCAVAELAILVTAPCPYGTVGFHGKRGPITRGNSRDTGQIGDLYGNKTTGGCAVAKLSILTPTNFTSVKSLGNSTI